MGKTYKVITGYEFGEMFIDHFNTLESATEEYNKAIKDECDFCYLLETEAEYTTTGDSCNKILSTFKRKQL